MWMQMLLFALALSADSFAVGVSYGFRKFSVPAATAFIIAGFSAGGKALAMLLGGALRGALSDYAGVLSAFILLGLAVCQVVRPVGRSGKDVETGGGPATAAEGVKSEEAGTLLVNLHLTSLGLVIRILKDPSAADVDRSHSIALHEAAFLGIALGLDAVGAGLGAGAMGLPVLSTSLVVGLAALASLPLGIRVGWSVNWELPAYASRLMPASVLVLLAVLAWLTA